MVIGSVLFASLLGVSYIFEAAAEYLAKQPSAVHVALAAKIMASVILVLDAVALLFFLSVSTFKFLRDTWHRLLKDDDHGTA